MPVKVVWVAITFGPISEDDADGWLWVRRQVSEAEVRLTEDERAKAEADTEQAETADDSVERMRKAVADDLADRILSTVVSERLWITDTRFPLANAAKVLQDSAEGLNSLIEQPLDVVATAVGMPNALASIGAGATANFVTAPLTGGIEHTAHVLQVAGLVFGLVLGLHPLMIACAKPLLKHTLTELMAEQIEELLAAPEAYKEESEAERVSARSRYGWEELVSGPSEAPGHSTAVSDALARERQKTRDADNQRLTTQRQAAAIAEREAG